MWRDMTDAALAFAVPMAVALLISVGAGAC